MSINPLSLSIRAKKLGVLIRDARLAANQSAEECAKMLGVSPEIYAEYELGEKSPSLPELELLAYGLNIPVEHFWDQQALTAGAGAKSQVKEEQLLALRKRIIGAKLRQARVGAGLSLEELAEKVWSSPNLLESYELGESQVPLPDLEVMCSVLDLPLREFRDQQSQVGSWSIQQRQIQDFMNLPPDLRAFVSKPVNKPYLELAQRLSEMSVEKLRAVAEGLLEITL